ncbi:hypothetical protein NGC89_02540 [Staphylococcus xylosus]|uniref:hypothetical protein n=1 Tax=Staphylococcus xylosus TaxID=1288 RepID=UPI002DBE1A86|nr:hypothetical protein [Staphylococcus xylosus]MEB7800344.1 hypothetical protein [Staphylococcus xylosus]
MYIIDFLTYLTDSLQYLDAFDNARRIFGNLLGGLRKVAPMSGAFCYAVGAYFWKFGGDNGKRNAKSWWIGTTVALIIIFGANSLVNWVQTNGRF